MARKKKTDVVAEPVIAPASAETEEIVSIKGFDKDFKCRGFQFEVGKTYEVEGDAKICENGFHAIEGYPLEVFDYYGAATGRFAEVRQSGKIARHVSDSKVASTKISISCELSLSTLIERAVTWVFARAKSEGASPHATGKYGAASATGWRGAASATGECGAASATGEYGAASATGKYGAASATGMLGAASATGMLGAASATGWRGAASATGKYGAASATGECGAATASGFYGRVMGADGSGLFLVHRNTAGTITHVWAGIVGKNGVKPYTWYMLNSNGELEEVA